MQLFCNQMQLHYLCDIQTNKDTILSNNGQYLIRIMKTTNRKYDLSKVMKRAHEILRKKMNYVDLNVKAHNMFNKTDLKADYSGLFSIALKEAWKYEKEAYRLSRQTARPVIFSEAAQTTISNYYNRSAYNGD